MKTRITFLIGFLLLTASRGDEGIETTELIVIAKQIRAELRLLDAMKDIYAIQNNQPNGAKISADQLRQALAVSRPDKARPAIRLSIVLNAPDGPKDLLGNSYGSFVVGRIPQLHPDTFAALAAVAPREFWGNYAPQETTATRRNEPPQRGKLTKCLSNAKQIAFACKLYSMDHQGPFPSDLNDLIPDYLPDRGLFSSPLAPKPGQLDYEYFGAGVKDTDAADKILLRGRYTTENGERTVVRVDLSGKADRQ
jgi:hypothetical protein